MKTCLVFTVLSMTLLGSLSCSTDSRLSPMAIVPSNSVIVLSAKWQEVTQDAKLKTLVKGHEIENALARLGINPASVTRLALFSPGLNSRDSDLGVILSGTYKAGGVISNLQSQGWIKHAYKGTALYGNTSNNQFLALLKGNLVAVGSRASVESTIDVSLNRQLAFTRQTPTNSLVRENGYPITIVLAMSQEAQDMSNALLRVTSFMLDIGEMGAVGDLLNTIGFARALSCSVSRKGANFPVEIKAVMKDENSASFVSGSLNLLKGASNLIPRDGMNAADRQSIDRFRDLQITRSGETLSIKMDIPESEILR